MRTTDLFKHGLKLNNADIEVLLAACASRGKNIGYLLGSAPRSNPGKMAWYAIMSNICPSRISVGALLFADAEDKALFERLSKLLEPAAKAIVLAEPYMRWNTWELNWSGQVRTTFHYRLGQICNSQNT